MVGRKQVQRWALRVGVVIALLGIGAFVGAQRSQATAPTMYFCGVTNNTGGNGISQTTHPRPGEHCFTTIDAAIRSLGQDPNLTNHFPPGVEVQVPADVHYSLKSCSITSRMGEHPAPGQRWFIHCVGGGYAVVTNP